LVNFNIVGLCNDRIDRCALIDIKDSSRSFTWSNNQKVPIMAILDRILMAAHWEIKYPLAKTYMLPKGINDHNPLMITFGVNLEDPIFRFEKWWLEIEGFENMVKETWSRDCSFSGLVDR
jgi:hypothetical protein